MIKRLASFANNSAMRSISLVTVGNLVNAVVGFVSLILVGRFLGPEMMGVFSVVFSFFAMLTKFGDIGSNSTLVKYVSEARANNDNKREEAVVGFGLGMTYTLVLVMLVITLPLYRWFADLFNIPQYSHLILLATILSFGWIMFNTYNVFLQGTERFKDYIITYSSSSVFKLVTILCLFVAGYFGLTQAVLIYLVTPLVGYFVGKVLFDLSVSYRAKPNLNREIFQSLSPFIYFMAAASIIAAVSEQLGVFLSSILFDSYQTGLYSAGTRLGMVFSLIAGSIGTVLIPRAAKYKEVAHVTAFAKKSLLLGLGIFVLFLPVVFFPTFFLYITVGPEYEAASSILIIAAITGGVQVMTSSFSAVFFSLNKAYYFTLSAIVTLAIEASIMLYYGPRMGIIALAVAKLVSSVVMLVMALIVYRSSLKQLVQPTD